MSGQREGGGHAHLGGADRRGADPGAGPAVPRWAGPYLLAVASILAFSLGLGAGDLPAPVWLSLAGLGLFGTVAAVALTILSAHRGAYRRLGRWGFLTGPAWTGLLALALRSLHGPHNVSMADRAWAGLFVASYLLVAYVLLIAALHFGTLRHDRNQGFLPRSRGRVRTLATTGWTLAAAGLYMFLLGLLAVTPDPSADDYWLLGIPVGATALLLGLVTVLAAGLLRRFGGPRVTDDSVTEGA